MEYLHTDQDLCCIYVQTSYLGHPTGAYIVFVAPDATLHFFSEVSLIHTRYKKCFRSSDILSIRTYYLFFLELASSFGLAVAFSAFFFKLCQTPMLILGPILWIGLFVLQYLFFGRKRLWVYTKNHKKYKFEYYKPLLFRKERTQVQEVERRFSLLRKK